MKHAQYLHPEKRNSISSTSGKSNIALHITRALENVLEEVFQEGVLGKNGCLISWKILLNRYMQLTAAN